MKTNVGILMGGMSSEHDVSLMSGEEVLQHIDRKKYNPHKLLIKKDGKFNFTLNKLLSMDIIFIALHGDVGENGSIQGYMETLGLKYTGPGVLASAVGMDKVISRNIWHDALLPIVPYTIIKSVEECEEKLLPFVLKPRAQGSSVGVSIVKSAKKIPGAFKSASEYGEDILLEPYIKGAEITVGILGKNNLEPLPVIQIVPNNEFYDYEAKYISDDTEYMIPADIPRRIALEAQKIAVEACELIGVTGFSRVDLLIDDDSSLLLEVNTIPGLTSHSLLPKAAKAQGISFTKLIDKIIQFALG